MPLFVSLFEDLKMGNQTFQKRFLTTSEAAEYLGLATKTLANYRYLGIGPAHRKVGNRIFYELDHLEAHICTKPLRFCSSVER